MSNFTNNLTNEKLRCCNRKRRICSSYSGHRLISYTWRHPTHTFKEISCWYFAQDGKYLIAAFPLCMCNRENILLLFHAGYKLIASRQYENISIPNVLTTLHEHFISHEKDFSQGHTVGTTRNGFNFSFSDRYEFISGSLHGKLWEKFSFWAKWNSNVNSL